MSAEEYPPLEPCPLCGGTDVRLEETEATGRKPNGDFWRAGIIWCPSCGLSLNSRGRRLLLAVHHWNGRPAVRKPARAAAEALAPFAAFAAQAVDGEGWSGREQNASIHTWFGPGDFRAASAAVPRHLVAEFLPEESSSGPS